MSATPLVSIITVNYRQAALTCELLRSLQHCGYPRLEVIVVDNGSQEDVSATFAEGYPGVQTIISHENLGFAGGNNLALARATGDYLFLINNDAEVVPGTIEALVATFQQAPDIGVVAPKIRYHEHPEIIQYAGFTPVHPITARNRTIGQGGQDRGQYDQLRETPYAHGAAMMISRAAFQQAGLMPTVYFLYYEELDWCVQIRRAGYRILFQPEAVVYHKESVSVGAHSPLQAYYLHRNRLLFMQRNAPWWSVISFHLFFLLITLPRWTLTYLLRNKPVHLRALYRAVGWHLAAKSQYKDPVEF